MAVLLVLLDTAGCIYLSVPHHGLCKTQETEILWELSSFRDQKIKVALITFYSV